MLVDFHVHSTASDGTFSPVILSTLYKERGFAAMALTDHDNCDGLAEFCGIPGIELSIEPGEGFHRFHLLGIGIDKDNAGLKAFLREVLEGRNRRNELIFERFHSIGIDIDPAELDEYKHGEVLARPHFARWLVKHNYAHDVKDAFRRYLLPDAPKETCCFVGRWHPPQEESFRVIHEAGGLCVMAHPKYWRDEWKRVGADFAAAERGLARLKEMGLDGLESLYQANTPEENIEFTRIADRLGFLKTAGSDFHGQNKPNITLGMEVSESFIAPFLEALPSR